MTHLGHNLPLPCSSERSLLLIFSTSVDSEVMRLNGFCFPRYRGGLTYSADSIGVAKVYRQIQAWHQQYGERLAPSALLAETGTPLCEAKPSRPM
jgi:hypothetical protein